MTRMEMIPTTARKLLPKPPQQLSRLNRWCNNNLRRSSQSRPSRPNRVRPWPRSWSRCCAPKLYPPQSPRTTTRRMHDWLIQPEEIFVFYIFLVGSSTGMEI
uniref:(northern house mosquito) hypothetical protein n=1 Tax=Culex pipiens TaxID=7175 RepID=A0A8D8NKP1_CULPI